MVLDKTAIAETGRIKKSVDAFVPINVVLESVTKNDKGESPQSEDGDHSWWQRIGFSLCNPDASLGWPWFFCARNNCESALLRTGRSVCKSSNRTTTINTNSTSEMTMLTRSSSSSKKDFNVNVWIMCHHYQDPQKAKGASPCTVMDVDESGISNDFDTSDTRDGHLIRLAYSELLVVYNGMVAKDGPWFPQFYRGKRNKVTRRSTHCVVFTDTRRLASAHLDEADVDGWNVIAGALELARIWALPGATVCHTIEALDRPTRAKLAICLIMSWKFQRANMTQMPSFFESETETERDCSGLEQPKAVTMELSFVGYSFLFADEQEEFGMWTIRNQRRVRDLQTLLVELEVELLKQVTVFSTLSTNALVEAEWELDRLHTITVLSPHNAMQTRAIIPFFSRVAMLTRANDSKHAESLYASMMGASQAHTSAGALIAAALLCLATAHWKNASYMRGACGYYFSNDTIEITQKLLTAALFATDDEFLRSGCYGNTEWHLSNSVATETLREAAQHAIVVGAHIELERREAAVGSYMPTA